MAFWDRLRAVFRREPATVVEPKKAQEEPRQTAVTRAAHATVTGQFRAAAAELRAARAAEGEALVLDAILISLPEEPPANDDAAWDELVLLVADVLVARGDRKRACDLLRRARSVSAKVLRADLLSEGLDGAAKPEDLDLALTLLSEVLRADIDAPGARERWERLRVRLGRGGETTTATVGATLLVDAPSLPFTLLREVARGGAGVVYEARAKVGPVERIIALKLAHQRPSGRAENLAYEAKIAVRFRGPNVVPILDVDPEEGWLAMAWAAGGSLRNKLRAPDDRELREPLGWFGALVEVVAAVHRDGLVHGDLKPANVLFDDRGNPWLGDFGLARPFGDPNTAGSAGYVSPERLAKSPCDPRDDVFALGRILEDLSAVCPSLAARRDLVRACTGPLPSRPKDADALLASLH